MKRLLLLACASAFSLGTLASYANVVQPTQPLDYSRPAAGERLAEAPGHFQFCTRYCWQGYAACKQQKTGASCDDQYKTCKATC